MKIVIETIPFEKQRYDTAGDWYYDEDGNLQIRISDNFEPAKQMCIAIHELIEAMLCQAHGITQEDVDAFDMGEGQDLIEPGDDQKAPYHHEHRFAMQIEILLALEMGLIDGGYL